VSSHVHLWKSLILTDFVVCRICSREKDLDPLANKSKQICVFIAPEEYDKILVDHKAFRQALDHVIEQHPELFPLADEKHTRFNGEKAYIATTVGCDCVLGASLTLGVGKEDLIQAYGHFKTEAQNLSPDYEPETVNLDGWNATQSAWRALFTKITIILCFLHSFIKIAQTYSSPTHKLNGFVYHDNWLHNLLISASMRGYRHGSERVVAIHRN